MTIKTISYAKVFPLAPYCNERIGVEVEINEGEDPAQAFEEAKAFVESCHTKPLVEFEWAEMEKPLTPPYGTGIPLPNDYTTISEIQVEKPQTTEERMIQQIGEITELKVLESFKLLSDKYPAVKAAYDNKLKQLQP
jgi:hypothetical protein